MVSLEKFKKLFIVLGLIETIRLDFVQTFKCGVRKRRVNDAIVLGEQTSPGDWPWHTAIYHRKDYITTIYVCGGTLISDHFVLTAIHCLKDNNYILSPVKVFVRFGVHNIQKLDRKTFQQHDVQKIRTCPSTTQNRNEIALLELSTQVEFTNFVQPACVNQVEDLTRQLGTAVGWGTDETDQISLVLKKATMPVVSGYQCLENHDGVFRLALDSSLFCAGFANGTTVCNGDSGGGLHFERNGVWYVGGIVAFTALRESSKLCHTKSYAAFTNVYNFLSWIRDVTQLQYLDETPESVDTIRINAHTNLLPQNCGQTLRNRISRGNDAKVFDYPWMAVLRYKHNRNDFLVGDNGGSIIHQRYVLTAAHALNVKSTLKLDHVILGEHTKNIEIDCNIYLEPDGEEIERDCADLVKRYEVESYVYHPDYNKPKFANDIGLIRLATDVTWEYHIQPICLPVTPQLQVKQFRRYIFTGWGKNENGTLPNVLQEASMVLVSNVDCRRRVAENGLKMELTENQMCVGGQNLISACRGDGGSPLGVTTNYNGIRFVQFGVNSFAIHSCGEKNIPSGFTRVASYMEWILQNIKQ